VDLSVELKVEFPEEMVLEMKNNAAKKVRRMVIGRTLGGRVTFKTLQECLKLHLPVSFISATLLTRGYFLILFENEDGAKATRKLTSVEWSGLNLSFSRYAPGFDANAQGAEAPLTHTIKIQFPDLHEQFRDDRALTIMASMIGEVLDIESADSYVKRPAGPMVTVKTKNITKLVGYIRIPSMAEGASITDTVRQRILYSGLPNQCRRCRKFGHLARACNTNINKPQESLAQGNPRPRTETRKQEALRQNTKPLPRGSSQAPPPNAIADHGVTMKAKEPQGARPQSTLTAAREQNNALAAKQSENSTKISILQASIVPAQKDIHMADVSASPTHALPPSQLGAERRKESVSTPRTQLRFGFPETGSLQTRPSTPITNPFASLAEGAREGGASPNPQEETSERWTFQGRKKHTHKLTSPRPETHSPIPHILPQESTPREKRGQQHSEVPPSYFTSLGITIPQDRESLKARIWPVLAREKNERKEIVVHSRSQEKPSLPASIRLTGPAEAEWTCESAWADLTQRLEMELEEKFLRYKLTLKDRPKLKWSWQEVPNRGGVECTILAHIDTGSSALSIQNKRNLRWKAMELIQG